MQVAVVVFGVLLLTCIGLGTLIPLSAILLCLAFILYTVEWTHCDTRRFLANIQQEAGAGDYVDALRRTKPGLGFSARCWHMETRTRQVTTTDGNGGRQTHTETDQVEVVTHSRAPRTLCLVAATSAPELSCFVTRGPVGLKCCGLAPASKSLHGRMRL